MSETLLCFENHRKDGRIVAIQHRGKWTLHKNVRVYAPMETVYEGKNAKQPRFYMRSLRECSVLIKNDITFIL